MNNPKQNLPFLHLFNPRHSLNEHFCFLQLTVVISRIFFKQTSFFYLSYFKTFTELSPFYTEQFLYIYYRSDICGDTIRTIRLTDWWIYRPSGTQEPSISPVTMPYLPFCSNLSHICLLSCQNLEDEKKTQYYTRLFPIQQTSPYWWPKLSWILSLNN